MKAISPDEWNQIWSRLDPETVGRTMSLSAFAQLCYKEKAGWYLRWPWVDFSNARYVVHLEKALKKGADVPDEYVASVTDDDLQFDRFCFPLLNARRSALQAAGIE